MGNSFDNNKNRDFGRVQGENSTGRRLLRKVMTRKTLKKL